MNAVPLKRLQTLDLSTELSNYVKSHYSEEEQKVSKPDLDRVNQLRIDMSAIQQPNDASFNTVSEYIAVLDSMKSRLATLYCNYFFNVR